MASPKKLPASAALSAFAESFCEGRRVLVFGNALSALPELLLDRGARLVHVCDPDPARAAQAAARATSGSLSFAPYAEGGPLALREGGFDAALVENLCAFDATRLLRELVRLLTPRGVALVACPNHEGPHPLLAPSLPSKNPLDYYALYDAVAGQFRHVRMLGQAPFVGYAVAEFSPEGEVEPVIDTAFLTRGSEEPEYFLALCSQHRVAPDSYALVQLPLADVLASGSENAVQHELERLRGAERQHRRRIAELEAMLKRGGKMGTATAALEHKLMRQDAWIRELEERAATADARADEATLELEELRRLFDTQTAEPEEAPSGPSAREAELEQERSRLEQELSRRDTRLSELEGALDTSRAALTERERRIAELAQAEDGTAAEELGALEAQLSERGHEVRRLQKDLREAERIGRELLRKGVADPTLLERLALAEADRIAAAWAAEALRLELDEAQNRQNP